MKNNPLFESDQWIESTYNGNFLPLVTLLSRYETMLGEHFSKVRTDKKQIRECMFKWQNSLFQTIIC